MDRELERAVQLIRGWLSEDQDSHTLSTTELKRLATRENIRAEDFEEALVQLKAVAYGNAMWGLPPS